VVVLYFCVRIGVRGDAETHLGAHVTSRSNLQKFPSHLKKAEGGGAGEAAKKLQGNFGVAKLAYQAFSLSLMAVSVQPTKDTL
jgi:hypothetical protein